MENLELKVIGTLPRVDVNFTEIEKQLKEELKQFDLIVDLDSVKTAKTMATQINKMKEKINRIRIDEVKRLSVPISEFEKKAKSLAFMCTESRQKLLTQIEVFDEAQKVECKKRLDKELIATYSKYGVNEEFQVVIVNDLIVISNLTKSGLAKKAITAIDDRVLEAKQFQEKINTRLLTLGTICYECGLSVPLTRENIDHFLKEGDDDVYLKKLVSLIQNEISRINLANERKREHETARAIQESSISIPPVQETKEQQTPVSQYSHFKDSQEFPRRTLNGKKRYTVTATFKVEVNSKMAKKLEEMLLQKFAKGGFKQIPSVFVEEVQNVA